MVRPRPPGSLLYIVEGTPARAVVVFDGHPEPITLAAVPRESPGCRYVRFHDKRHPAELDAPEVTTFLTSLAVKRPSPRQ